MLTPWADTLDRAQPLPEYPRPQMARDSYLNLNGPWSYAITTSAQKPAQADGTILVPFSPESELSGVGHVLQPEEYLWYIRTVTLPDGFNVGRVLLHFGAVDQIATVWCNGVELTTHTGGYLPFTVDITEVLAKENTILVCVRDATNRSQLPRGKQTLHPHGIWYTPQSGIWQTVWLESVPQNYIHSLRVTPLFDAHQVEITVEGAGQCTIDLEGKRFTFPAGVPAHVPVQSFRPWSPEHPTLYPFSVTLGDDTVYSYFAMRKCSVETDANGVRRLFLNGKPYFHNGLLDQGYWPDGLYTAPSDDALIYDIQLAKDMGFNMLRKHIKVECDRWYYHCDRLGMLVWQDMVNGGSAYKHWFVTYLATLMNWNHISFSDDEKHAGLLSRLHPEGKDEFRREITETIAFLYNHPSIVVWVPFNEGWGQFDALAACEQIRTLDSSRLVDHASGWFDQKGGDILSLHYYFLKLKFKPEGKRAAALTEFGGYSLSIPGHSCCKKVYGYKKFNSTGTLTYGYIDLIRQTILPAVKKGIGATVYTQLSDIEEETNGIYTYDREICKIDPDTLRKWNRALKEAGECKTYADHTTDH